MAQGGIGRRLAAEALGSCLLVAIVIGSGILGERLAAGNAGVALLANSIATGAGLVALILTFGPVSGAHFNPAVSLAFCLRGELPLRETLFYGAAQIAGALAGAMLAHVMYGMDIVQNATQIRSSAGELVGEAMATAMLLLVIFACVARAPAAVPYAVGLVITANYWATSSTSFANPAVTIARTITDTFTSIRPIDAAFFVAVQLAAAIAATVFFRWLYAETERS